MTVKDWVAVLCGALGAFIAILDIQVTNASLREISASLSLDISESGWISTAYLIAEIIIIPMTAFLSQVLGLRRYLVISCTGFLIASICCGLAWNIQMMIFFRALQGITGGALIPLSFQIILSVMPERLKHLGLTIFGLTVTMAPTLGPTLGGWLTDEYGWRFIFFLNLVPGILMIAGLQWGLPESKPSWDRLKQFDVFSFVSLVLGLSALTYFLEEGPKVDWFESLHIRISSMMALFFLPLFVVRQFELEHPLLRLSLFKNWNFALGNLITAVSGCALFSGIYSLSLYLGQVQDYSAAQIGHILMWVGFPQLIVMPFLPILMKKVDLRFLALFGMALFAYSNFLNSSLDLHFSGDQFKWSLLMRALGQPLFVIPLSAMAMAVVSKEQAADASSIFNVMRNLGASLGIALTSTILVKRQGGHFQRLTEKMSAYDFSLTEEIYKIEMKLRGIGLDAVSAKSQAIRVIMRNPVRDSLIESFSDIFFILTIALGLCALVILLLKKTRISESSESVLEH